MANQQDSASTKRLSMKWWDYPVCLFFAFQFWISIISFNLISLAVMCILWLQYEEFRKRGNSRND